MCIRDREYALWDNKTHAYSDVKEKAVYLQAGDDINYLSYKWSKKDKMCIRDRSR